MAVAGRPSVTWRVALVPASSSMVTTMIGRTIRTTSLTWDSEAYAVGFRGITALDREGRVSVIRPGDFDGDESMRWEEGDDE